MEITGLQWNIQAARVRQPEADALALDSYAGDRPEYIGNYLAARSLDFITLQEVHANTERNQAEEIAAFLGDVSVVTDSYGQSFMNPDYGICQSVISRHPIASHRYIPLQFAPYTPVNLDDLDGEYLAKDTGLTVATLDIEGAPLNAVTLHMQPFSLFAIDPYGDAARELRASLEEELAKLEQPWILQADFNVNDQSIDTFLGDIAKLPGYTGLVQLVSTIPAGKTIDHVAGAGVEIISSEVDATTLTDHYPVITRFKVPR